MGQTSNLIFDEPYGNEQNMNSVSAWNVSSLAPHDVKLSDVCFPEDVNTRRRTFLSFFLSELQCAPSDFNSETIRLTVYTFREL